MQDLATLPRRGLTEALRARTAAAGTWAREHPVAFATLVHLAATVVLFSPFLFRGLVLIGSTDLIFNMYPNMFFNARSIQAGDLGLWNPYILGGIDFTASAHNYLFNVLTWPLFVLPWRWFPYALSARAALEVFLVGAFGYRLFQRELEDRRWALVASVIYQLGTYTMFSMTSYPNTQLFMLSTLALLVIWSVDERPLWRSWLALTAIFAVILLAMNHVYCLSAMLFVTILFHYRISPSRPRWKREWLIFYAAAFGALALALPKWLPFAHALLFENARLSTGFGLGASVGRVFTLLTAFAPETYGIHFTNSISIFRSFDPNDGGHAQFHAMNYFGASAGLLVIISFIVRPKDLGFWKGYLVLGSAWLLLVPPISAVLTLIVQPFSHAIIPKMLIPISVAVLAAVTGRHLERHGMTRKQQWALLLSIVGVIALAVVVWAIHLSRTSLGPRAQLMAKGVLFAAAAVVILAGVGVMSSPRRYRLLLLPMAVCAAGSLYLLRPADAASMPLLTLAEAGTAAAMVGAVAFAVTVRTLGIRHPRAALLIAGAIIAMEVVVATFPFAAGIALSDAGVRYMACFGLVKFATLGLCLLSILSRIDDVTGLRPHLPWLMAGLLLVDLLPYSAVYGRMNTEFFQSAGQFVPRELQGRTKAASAAATNLLSNPSFERWSVPQRPDSWTAGGQPWNLSATTVEAVRGRRAARLRSPTGDAALYQDVTGSIVRADATFSFGIWVKVEEPSPEAPRVMIADGVAASPMAVYDGKVNGWQWLTTTLRTSSKPQYVRPHVIPPAGGSVLVDGAALVEGDEIGPLSTAPTETFDEYEPGFMERTVRPVVRESIDFDLANYRVNHPHMVLGVGNEPQSNMFTISGIRSYAGVNSDNSPDLHALIRAFEPEAKGSAAAIQADATDSVLLDLLGCRYDFVNGSVIERPGALSRFMLFTDLRSVDSKDEMTRVLAGRSVTVNRTLLVASIPPESAHDTRGAAIPLRYTSRTTSDLTVHVDSPTGGMVFFGDMIHSGWKALVDGRETPIVRANAVFMAVPVTRGAHEVRFQFSSPLMVLGFEIALLALVVIASATVVMIVRGRRDVGIPLKGSDDGTESGPSLHPMAGRLSRPRRTSSSAPG